jgi:hypothetical protein
LHTFVNNVDMFSLSLTCHPHRTAACHSAGEVALLALGVVES